MADLATLVPSFVSALFVLTLAGWLFIRTSGAPAPRAFSWFLLIQGLLSLVRTLSFLDGQPPEQIALWNGLQWYFAIAIVPALAYFLVLFAFPRHRKATVPIRFLLIVAVLSFELLYATNHCLARCDDQNGPLSLLNFGRPAMATLLALWFAAQWASNPNASERQSYFFVSAGFLLIGLLESTAAAFGAMRGLPSELEGDQWFQAGVFLNSLAIALGLLALAVHAWTARREAAHRQRTIRVLGLAVAAVASGLLVELVADVASLAEFVTFLLFAIWRAALPVFIVYALIRYHLFDVNWKMRIALRHGSLATISLGVFFVSTQILEELFETLVATGAVGLQVLGAVVLGVAVFFMHPLQRFADRLSAEAMPDSKPLDELTSPQKIRLYEDHARLAWQDGSLSSKERLLLEHLRRRLGLALEQARRIEDRAMRALS